MAESNIVRRVCRIGLKGIGYVSFLAPLLARLVVGYIFYQAGHGKTGNLDGVTDFFKDLGIPFPHANAVFIAYLEYIGGMCVIVGLFTRPVSALLGSTMIVALMTADHDDLVKAWSGTTKMTLIDVSPVALGMLLLWLLMYGPGLLSIDAIIRKAIGVDEPETPATTPVQA